jgi:hypothetical protein
MAAYSRYICKDSFKDAKIDTCHATQERVKHNQVLSEQLSSFGIPVLMMDIKGFSGIAKEGVEKSLLLNATQN